MADAPFENDRLWFWVTTDNGPHVYLYNLKNRAILGELFDAAPTEICRRDGSRLLVRGFESAPPAKKQVSSVLQKVFGLRLPGSGNRNGRLQSANPSFRTR